MTRHAKFRHSLGAVHLLRGWARDEAGRRLAAVEQDLSAAMQGLSAVTRQIDELARELRAGRQGTSTVIQLSVISTYVGDLTRRRRALEGQIDGLEQRRDAALLELRTAHEAAEVIEKHRGDELKAHRRSHEFEQLKSADEMVLLMRETA